MPHRNALPLLSAALLLLPGCGGDLPATIPASGVLTFQGAAPPAEGYLMFQPLQPAEGYPYRPASGKFDTAGRFTVGSFEEADGIVPGRYRVEIECWKTPPDEVTGSPGISHVPTGFAFPELEVPPGSPALNLTFDVP